MLDKVFINVPNGYKIHVFKSLVKTKHQTVLVDSYGVLYCVPNEPRNLHNNMTNEVTILSDYIAAILYWYFPFVDCVFLLKSARQVVYFSTALGLQSTAAFLVRLLDEVKRIKTIVHRLLSHYYVNDPSYANMVILRRTML